jgi:hypothetical protein
VEKKRQEPQERRTRGAKSFRGGSNLQGNRASLFSTAVHVRRLLSKDFFDVLFGSGRRTSTNLERRSNMNIVAITGNLGRAPKTGNIVATFVEPLSRKPEAEAAPQEEVADQQADDTEDDIPF